MEVLARNDGRVLELFDVGRSVVRGAASCRHRVGAGTDRSERGADAPGGRNDERRLNGDVADRSAGRVEQQFLPFEDGQLLANPLGDNAIQVGMNRGNAIRHNEVELVEVHVVPTPLDWLAVGGENHAGNLLHWASWPVVAGNPSWRSQGERPCCHRKIDLSVIELSRRVGQVRCYLNGWSLCVDRGKGADERKGSDQGGGAKRGSLFIGNASPESLRLPFNAAPC